MAEAFESDADKADYERVVADHPPCRQCSSCPGFRAGNPSTSCFHCGHDWQQHNH